MSHIHSVSLTHEDADIILGALGDLAEYAESDEAAEYERVRDLVLTTFDRDHSGEAQDTGEAQSESGEEDETPGRNQNGRLTGTGPEWWDDMPGDDTPEIIHTTCRYCGLDIEGDPKSMERGNWRDRGGNWYCPHTPPVTPTTHEPPLGSTDYS
jgi:hypothetical protein